MKLPIYRDTSKKGEDGITILKRIVEKELHWIFRVNHQEHDFGIDAYFDIVTELNQITGKTIAIQVKTGKSYFKEKNSFGWIYRGEMSHLNYYLNQEIPVIIVIVDEIKTKAYWCLCDASRTEAAGKNWKITIPFDKELNSEAKKELLNYVSPVRDYASQLENFWKLNAELKSSDRILIKIDREFVENNSPYELLAVIERLKVNSEIISKTKEKIDINIDGYDYDSRELMDIPEFRNWLKEIFNEINGWTYFLSKDRNAQFLKLIFLVHMKFDKVGDLFTGELGLLSQKVEFDIEDAVPILEMLYSDLNIFCEKHNIPKEVNVEISSNLIEYLIGKRPILNKKNEN